MEILKDDVRSPDVLALLERHHAFARATSPPESIHALDLDGLRQPHVTVWAARRDGVLCGFGALAEIDPSHGEVKSMHTAAEHRRAGVADRLLRHILDEARRRGYARVSLETGSMDAFAPARALYARHGFQTCGPFAGYVEDPNSAFMTLALQAP